jgi:hypothetical protein
MKYGSWVAGTASAAAVVALALWVDASETGRSDGGLRAEPASQESCVGSRPGPGGQAEEPDTPLDRTLARIEQLATGRHADVYTGLAIDEDTATADVWRIPSAAFQEAVCRAAEQGVTVRFHDADASRRDLDALAERIGEDMSRWDGTFQMREVGVDERGYVEVVHVEQAVLD